MNEKLGVHYDLVPDGDEWNLVVSVDGGHPALLAVIESLDELENLMQACTTALANLDIRSDPELIRINYIGGNFFAFIPSWQRHHSIVVDPPDDIKRHVRSNGLSWFSVTYNMEARKPIDLKLNDWGDAELVNDPTT